MELGFTCFFRQVIVVIVLGLDAGRFVATGFVRAGDRGRRAL